MTESDKKAALEAFLEWHIANENRLFDLEEAESSEKSWIAACEWMASRAAMPAGDGWMPVDEPKSINTSFYFIREPSDSVYTQDKGQWYKFKLPPLPQPPAVEDKP
jgi:hypothetical protein